MRFLHARVWCGLAVAARVLTACGGGGGSGTLPASGSSVGPSPAITATTMPTATATATSTPGIVSGAGFAKIRHVVVIVQENRTPDNLFHGLPGADIASTGITSSGQTVTLQPIPLNAPYDLDHSHNGFVKMYDGGKMDGADRVGTGCGPSCQYSNPQFGYVPPASVQPYFSLATQYVFADRMFQTNQGPSYPAHQYLFGGTSLALPTSVNLVSENPHPPGGGNDTGNNDSCAGIAGSYVQTLAADGSTSNVFPCFERQTIADLLDA